MNTTKNQSLRTTFQSFVEGKDQIIKRTALSEAKTLASAGATQEAIDNHVKGIVASYSALSETVKANIQNANETGQMDQDYAIAERESNSEEVKVLKEEIRGDETDLRKLHITYNWANYWLRCLAELLIFGGEVSYNSLAFSVMGGAILFAILPAIVFAVGLAFTSFFVPRYLKGIANRINRFFTGVAFSILMFAVFVAVGILRSVSALGDGTLASLATKNVQIGIVIFTVINVFMFFSAMVVSWGLPSKDDSLAKQEHNRLSKKIAQAKKEVKRLEKANRSIQSEARVCKAGQLPTGIEVAYFETLVQQFCEVTVRAFLAEFNIKKSVGSNLFSSGMDFSTIKSNGVKTVIIICVSSLLGLSSCRTKGDTPPAIPTDIVSVIIDRTDPLLSLPDSAGICKYFDGLNNDHSRGGIFRLGQVTDIEHTPTTEFSLPPQSFLMQNPGERTRAIRKFFANVNTSLVNLQNLPVGKSNSEIYSVIAREANHLAGMGGKRTLIIYSNLYENTEIFSMYRREGMSDLLHNPGKVRAIFEQEQPLQDLTRVELRFIYLATDQRDSQRYSAISKLYTEIFKSRNATVVISAN